MRLTEPVLTKRIPGCVPGISDGGTAARATVSFEQYKATGGYASLAKALDMEPAKVIELVKEAVVRGRGGAGFRPGSSGRSSRRMTARGTATSASIATRPSPAPSRIACSATSIRT